MKKTICIIIILIIVLCFFGCKSSDYNKAVALQDAGSYAEAIPLFEKIGDYKDSSTRLNDCKTIVQYENAIEKQNNSQYGKPQFFLKSSAIIRTVQIVCPCARI